VSGVKHMGECLETENLKTEDYEVSPKYANVRGGPGVLK